MPRQIVTLMVFLSLLITACTSPKNEAIKSLAKMNIPFQPKNFLECIIQGNLSAVSLFLKAGMPADEGDNGLIPLIEASRRGHAEVALALIDSEADVNARDKYGVTALMYAAITGSPEVMERLIKAGAEVNARDIDGRTALVEALTSENSCPSSVIHSLLEAGADPNITVYGGLTPLMLAAPGDSVVIEMLIQAGADVNAQDERGATALMRAKNNPENIQLLKKAGAVEQSIQPES